MPYISVVIPTYKRPNILKMALFALNNQTFTDFEVIIVCDGPASETRNIINNLANEFKFPFRFIERPHAGPAAARNSGALIASGEVLLFTGDDMILHKDCLNHHYQVHKNNLNCSVLGFVDWHPDLEITPFMQYLSPNGPQFMFDALKGKSQADFRFFYTSNVSIRRAIFLENLFDEEFQHPAVEDIELGYRLEKKGIILRYCPSAIVYHYHNQDINSFMQRNVHVVNGYKILLMKHPELKDFIIPKRINVKVKILNFVATILDYVGLRQNPFYYRSIIVGDLYSKMQDIL